MKNLTLLIPAKNEKESLPIVLKEIKKLDCKIKVILEKDDLETINSIKEFNCEIIYQKRKGYGDALIEGINSVDTKFFCIFNADGSFNPDELLAMKLKLEETESDLVFASRYGKNSGSDDDTFVTLIGNYFFSYLCKVLFKIKIKDILYTFVMGDTSMTKKLNLKQTDFTFCIELPIKAHLEMLKITSINSFERSRIAGKKKVNAFKDGLFILLYIFRLFFKFK